MVTISAESTVIGRLSNKLVLDELSDRMIERLIVHHRVSRPLAERMIGFLWHRWTGRIIRDLEFQHRFGSEDQYTQQQWAERIMDAALGYWRACSALPQRGLGPSPLVDIGVHVGHLYTMEFEVLSFALAGRFLHHCPTDVPGVEYSRAHPIDMAAIQRELGLQVDGDLWTATASCGARDCTGGDCTESGPAFD